MILHVVNVHLLLFARVVLKGIIYIYKVVLIHANRVFIKMKLIEYAKHVIVNVNNVMVL